MGSNTQKKKKELLKRVNTRIREDQDAFIKNEVKRSKGKLTEGVVHRDLLDEGITSRKRK